MTIIRRLFHRHRRGHVFTDDTRWPHPILVETCRYPTCPKVRDLPNGKWIRR